MTSVHRGSVRVLKLDVAHEFLPGKEGLVHVSELDNKFVKRPEDVVKVGDEVTVKIIEVDAQNRVNLSRKQAMLDEKK